MSLDALGAISQLVTSFAGESEEAQKRAFNINKAINIAQAIINTAGAISAAINPAVGGLGIPAGLPGAVIAGVTGAAQVAAIAKTRFESTGGGTPPPSPTGLGGGSGTGIGSPVSAALDQLKKRKRSVKNAARSAGAEEEGVMAWGQDTCLMLAAVTVAMEVVENEKFI